MTKHQQETIKRLRHDLAHNKRLVRQIVRPKTKIIILGVDENKYSKMWAQANRWHMPSELVLPIGSDKRSFLSGAWAVLDLMRKDNLLPDETINYYWMNRDEQ